jgi:peptidoglycan hydrolase FlgJ
MTLKQITFVKNNWENAKSGFDKFSINPIILLSQSAKETGWGDSNRAKTQNNYFGIKATGNTNQYWKGQSQSGFRTYANPIDSFLDYANLIANNSRYADVYKYRDNIQKYFENMSLSSYITDADNRQKYYSDLLNISKSITNIADINNLYYKNKNKIFSIFAISLGFYVIYKLNKK